MLQGRLMRTTVEEHLGAFKEAMSPFFRALACSSSYWHALMPCYGVLCDAWCFVLPWYAVGCYAMPWCTVGCVGLCDAMVQCGCHGLWEALETQRQGFEGMKTTMQQRHVETEKARERDVLQQRRGHDGVCVNISLGIRVCMCEDCPHHHTMHPALQSVRP